MDKLIYKSDFKTGQESTRKQNILFSADASYAYSEGYEYIKSADGDIYILSKGSTLLLTDSTEEELISEAQYKMNESPKPVEINLEEYCINCHNLMLIDEIINNTLKQKGDITPQQADTMLKLAHLKEKLGD